MAACCSHSQDIMPKVEFHLVATSCTKLCCGISSCYCLAGSVSLSICERLKCSTILRHLAKVVANSATASPRCTDRLSVWPAQGIIVSISSSVMALVMFLTLSVVTAITWESMSIHHLPVICIPQRCILLIYIAGDCTMTRYYIPGFCNFHDVKETRAINNVNWA